MIRKRRDASSRQCYSKRRTEKLKSPDAQTGASQPLCVTSAGQREPGRNLANFADWPLRRARITNFQTIINGIEGISCIDNTIRLTFLRASLASRLPQDPDHPPTREAPRCPQNHVQPRRTLPAQARKRFSISRERTTLDSCDFSSPTSSASTRTSRSRGRSSRKPLTATSCSTARRSKGSCGSKSRTCCSLRISRRFRSFRGAIQKSGRPTYL